MAMERYMHGEVYACLVLRVMGFVFGLVWFGRCGGGSVVITI